MTDKHYIELDGIVYFPQGVTDELFDKFMDEFIELVEKHNGQSATTFSKKSEEELDA